MTTADLGAALGPIVDAFAGLEVSHYVCGSLASSAHGVPRASIDADFVADLRPQHADALIAALTPGFYVPERRLREAIDEGTSFSVIHLASMFKVDVFVVGDSPIRRETAQT